MRRAIGSLVDLWDKAGCAGQLVLVLVLAVVLGLPCGALSLVVLPPTPIPGATTARATLPVATATSALGPGVPAASSTGTLAAGETPSPTPLSVATPSEAVPAQVVRVVTGDSIDVAIEGRVYAVSYAGIDSPDPFGEPLGLEALARNEGLVGGETVLLERDVTDADSFGRLLRYVYVGELMVNAELVRLGYARASISGSNVKHQALLLGLEREARGARRGLWALEQTAGTVEPLPTATTTVRAQATVTTTVVPSPTLTITTTLTPGPTETPEPTYTVTPTPRPSATPTGTPTPSPSPTSSLPPPPTATEEPTSPQPTVSASPGCPAEQYFPARLCSGCPEFIGSRRTKLFYYPWCRDAQKIGPVDLECFYSREEAIAAGYTPDDECVS